MFLKAVFKFGRAAAKRMQDTLPYHSQQYFFPFRQQYFSPFFEALPKWRAARCALPPRAQLNFVRLTGCL